MKFIQGKDRDQVEFFSLSQAIADDNEVRLIDLFVHAIKLSEYGFKTDFIDNGRPAYHPADLLKLFIYGYMNRIRSSRHLEKAAKHGNVSTAPGHCGASIWSHQAPMGFLLRDDQKDDQTCFRRCWTHIHQL